MSTFRGEGDLSNLQLDEEVLTELLELPSWIRLTSAWCNHVSFRISWTKLKSTPITLVCILPPTTPITTTTPHPRHSIINLRFSHYHTYTRTQSLDEVNITIETCELGRSADAGGAAGAAGGGWQTLTAPQGKYTFVNKIIDGITVTVNTVNVNFKSPAFTASVQVSLFVGCSWPHFALLPQTLLLFSLHFPSV